MKSFFALAALAALTAAPAMAESFSRDGETYNYRVKSVGDATLISGTNLNTGEAFRLRVSGSMVSGKFGDSSVKFRMPAAEVAIGGSAQLMAAK